MNHLRLQTWVFGIWLDNIWSSNRYCWLTVQCSISIKKTALQLNLELWVVVGGWWPFWFYCQPKSFFAWILNEILWPLNLDWNTLTWDFGLDSKNLRNLNIDGVHLNFLLLYTLQIYIYKYDVHTNWINVKMNWEILFVEF